MLSASAQFLCRASSTKQARKSNWQSSAHPAAAASEYARDQFEAVVKR